MDSRTFDGDLVHTFYIYPPLTRAQKTLVLNRETLDNEKPLASQGHRRANTDSCTRITKRNATRKPTRNASSGCQRHVKHSDEALLGISSMLSVKEASVCLTRIDDHVIGNYVVNEHDRTLISKSRQAAQNYKQKCTKKRQRRVNSAFPLERSICTRSMCIELNGVPAVDFRQRQRGAKTYYKGSSNSEEHGYIKNIKPRSISITTRKRPNPEEVFVQPAATERQATRQRGTQRTAEKKPRNGGYSCKNGCRAKEHVAREEPVAASDNGPQVKKWHDCSTKKYRAFQVTPLRQKEDLTYVGLHNGKQGTTPKEIGSTMPSSVYCTERTASLYNDMCVTRNRARSATMKGEAAVTPQKDESVIWRVELPPQPLHGAPVAEQTTVESEMSPVWLRLELKIQPLQVEYYGSTLNPTTVNWLENSSRTTGFQSSAIKNNTRQQKKMLNSKEPDNCHPLESVQEKSAAFHRNNSKRKACYQDGALSQSRTTNALFALKSLGGPTVSHAAEALGRGTKRRKHMIPNKKNWEEIQVTARKGTLKRKVQVRKASQALAAAAGHDDIHEFSCNPKRMPILSELLQQESHNNLMDETLALGLKTPTQLSLNGSPISSVSSCSSRASISSFGSSASLRAAEELLHVMDRRDKKRVSVKLLTSTPKVKATSRKAEKDFLLNLRQLEHKIAKMKYKENYEGCPDVELDYFSSDSSDSGTPIKKLGRTKKCLS